MSSNNNVRDRTLALMCIGAAASSASYRDDHLLVKPWPHFGIVGDEGIYGYFGSASRSRAVPVIVRP